MKTNNEIVKKLESLIDDKQENAGDLDLGQRSYLEGCVDTLVWVKGRSKERKACGRKPLRTK